MIHRDNTERDIGLSGTCLVAKMTKQRPVEETGHVATLSG